VANFGDIGVESWVLWPKRWLVRQQPACSHSTRICYVGSPEWTGQK